MMMYSETRGISGGITLFSGGSKKVELKVWDVRVEDTEPEIMENGIQRLVVF